MECKVSDLVKRGHDQAAELKASCGAVDVRDVAQLISDLATQLDVQLARSNSLAAENAGLKSAIEKHADSYIMCGYCRTERDGKNDDVCEVLDSIPDTDAFLAEVRASGVEMAVDVVKQCYDNICAGGLQENREYEESIVQPHLDGIDDELKEIIAQLRKGVQS
ncbi:hypothetical protein ACS6IV_13120 [Enterobacter hormaechei subsp. xiangfangensis]|uniref:hypothetical protein n=1 Tax=Enterobacter hormaechei TaxID=158836 RepID=UPI003F434178